MQKKEEFNFSVPGSELKEESGKLFGHINVETTNDDGKKKAFIGISGAMNVNNLGTGKPARNGNPKGWYLNNLQITIKPRGSGISLGDSFPSSTNPLTYTIQNQSSWGLNISKAGPGGTYSEATSESKSFESMRTIVSSEPGYYRCRLAYSKVYEDKLALCDPGIINDEVDEVDPLAVTGLPVMVSAVFEHQDLEAIDIEFEYELNFSKSTGAIWKLKLTDVIPYAAVIDYISDNDKHVTTATLKETKTISL